MIGGVEWQCRRALDHPVEESPVRRRGVFLGQLGVEALEVVERFERTGESDVAQQVDQLDWMYLHRCGGEQPYRLGVIGCCPRDQ